MATAIAFVILFVVVIAVNISFQNAVHRGTKKPWGGVSLPTHSDVRGHLTVIEKLSFPIRRVYYIHGVPSGALRGGHAHKKVERLIVAISGSFKANIGGNEVSLRDPRRGLYVPPLTWLELTDFSPGAICLILASEEHDEADCIRTREELEEYLND